MKIIKKDLTEKIYKSCLQDYASGNKIRKQDVLLVIDLFLQNLIDEILNGNTVELRGFGIFERKIQKARFFAKDPRNGRYLDCKDHYKASFHQSKKLKNRMKEIPVPKK